jgi:hypothetical protein
MEFPQSINDLRKETGLESAGGLLPGESQRGPLLVSPTVYWSALWVECKRLGRCVCVCVCAIKVAAFRSRLSALIVALETGDLDLRRPSAAARCNLHDHHFTVCLSCPPFCQHK